jgi:hypothetical protein
MNEQDSPRRDLAYIIPQKVNVTNTPCSSQRPPYQIFQWLQDCCIKDSILSMTSTLKEIRIYRAIWRHTSHLHQYMNQKSLWNMFPNIGDEVKRLTQSSPSLNPKIYPDHVISKT